MKPIIIIPARLQSTRLPRKLLLRETGKPLIQHTYESACRSELASEVIVATDCQEIVDAVEEFGGTVVLTRADHVCGTDRVAEVAAGRPEFDIVVNVQGDEPEIPASAIDAAISKLADDPTANMATLATPIGHRKQFDDPACVKVVCNAKGQALYFSRSPIPFPRNGSDELFESDPPVAFQHIGLYAYRRETLAKIPNLPKPLIESVESLEQLRVLYAGIQIEVAIVDHPVVGIDTAEDYASFVSRHANR